MRAKSSFLSFLAGLLLASAAPLVAAQADAPEKVGVNAAVNTDANGTPPGGITKKLVIGEDVVHNERITTDANGQTQILFVDGSSVSVGPNSELTIDDFVFDPKTGTGKMTLTDLQGAMRFVGGKLSKQEDAVSVHLGTATIGVRGGIFLADTHRGGRSDVIFVFGKAVDVSGQSGCVQQLYRPGFAVSIDRPGGCPDSPHPLPLGTMSSILLNLDGRAGSHGGATTIPTNATVAASTVPNTVSNDVQVSIQQATDNAGPVVTPPTPVVSPPQVPTNQVQATSSQTQPIVVTPTPPTPPTPTGITGSFKIARPGTTGFENSITSVAGFNATITYPTGSPGQNGTLNGSVPSDPGFTFSVTPLTEGQTTNVIGTAILNGVPNNKYTSGPLTLTSDGDFFFADTVAPGDSGGDNIFFFGGTPVSSSFYTTTSPTRQFLAFAIQPDYTLGSGSQAQTIPFLPSFAGGTLGNAVVSPMYVVTQPNQPFGAFNANTNPNVTSPVWLQASLAINGPTSNQQDALVIATGSFDTSTTLGSVVANGPIRGTYMAGGALTQMTSASTTVPDVNGNTLFGGSSIDGFVLDQNRTDASGNYTQQDASTVQIGASGSNTSFGFNQPVLATTLPSGVGSSRTITDESGFFGGIMENGHGLHYAILGGLELEVNQANSTLGAVFGGTDPFTSSSSGINSMVLQFGTLSGRNFARSTYIDDNIFGATESYTLPVEITTPGNTTITYPTQSNASTGIPTAAMVTSATVPGAINSLLPSGVTPCACQYLQWGYWQANIPASNQGGPSNTVQSSYINTWVAGMPTVNLPATGSGSYSGAAFGTVSNNGVTYLAAGGYNLNYNFGNNSGTVSISNFDNHTFTGSVSGGGGGYAATLAGSGTNGSLVGQFFGPGAAETGGSFAVHQNSGPSYIASGIFAAKLTGPIH